MFRGSFHVWFAVLACIDHANRLANTNTPASTAELRSTVSRSRGFERGPASKRAFDRSKDGNAMQL